MVLYIIMFYILSIVEVGIFSAHFSILTATVTDEYKNDIRCR